MNDFCPGTQVSRSQEPEVCLKMFTFCQIATFHQFSFLFMLLYTENRFQSHSTTALSAQQSDEISKCGVKGRLIPDCSAFQSGSPWMLWCRGSA